MFNLGDLTIALTASAKDLNKDLLSDGEDAVPLTCCEFWVDMLMEGGYPKGMAIFLADHIAASAKATAAINAAIAAEAALY